MYIPTDSGASWLMAEREDRIRHAVALLVERQRRKACRQCWWTGVIATSFVLFALARIIG